MIIKVEKKTDLMKLNGMCCRNLYVSILECNEIRICKNRSTLTVFETDGMTQKELTGNRAVYQLYAECKNRLQRHPL